MPGPISYLRRKRWHEDQVQRWNASATSAGVLSVTTTRTIAIIADVRPAAAGTMTTIVAVRCRPGMTRDGSPARGRVTTMTMTITGVAARGTVVGTAIPRGIRKPHVAVGTSERGLAVAIVTTIAAARCLRATTKAGS